MKTSKVLKMEIANNSNSIKSVEVHYKNGEKVNGFVHSIEFPLKVTLCKHLVYKGEDPYHNVSFDDAIKVILLYYIGEAKIFE